MSVFTPAGSGGVITTVAISGISVPTITNISIPLANTEVSHALPADTKKFLIKMRGNSSFKLSFSAGTSGTVFMSTGGGGFFSEEDITATSLTLYFQSPAAGETAEIWSWV